MLMKIDSQFKSSKWIQVEKEREWEKTSAAERFGVLTNNKQTNDNTEQK